MKIRGIDFGHVLDASGVRGFFGEGYPYHRILRPLGLDFRGSTFVAKTCTLRPRPGNMALRDDWTPKRLRPDCVVARFRQGIVLNAVGLSNPGAEALFNDGRWQARKEPFFLSFMPMEEEWYRRAGELQDFLGLMRRHLPKFQAPVGLQVNLSCPNVEHGLHSLIQEAAFTLAFLNQLDVPIVVKIDLSWPIQTIIELGRLPTCDAICLTNAPRWGTLPAEIDWLGLFGTPTSPLERYGGGGLSGRPLLPLVADRVHRLRALGFKKPINAGGGILGPEDVKRLCSAGASSVFLGSIAMLRGWRVRKTIRAAQALFA